MTADAKTIEALREALDDAYKARATYRKVIEGFGPVRPFVNIVEAEDRHARALITLFSRFGVEPEGLLRHELPDPVGHRAARD